MRKRECVFFCGVELTAREIGATTTNYPYPRIIRRMVDSGEWRVTVFSARRQEAELYNEDCRLLPFSARSWLTEVLFRRHVDLLITHLTWHPAYVILTKVLRRAPLVFRTGGISGKQEDMLRPRYFMRRKQEWVLYRFCNFLVSTADGTPVRLHFKRMGVPARKYREYPNAFRPLPGTPEPRQKTVLFIGRLAKGKATDYVVDSFHRALPELEEGYKLIFCGGGVHSSPYEQSLRDRVARLGIERSVEFHPWTGDSSTYYRRCKMVVTGCGNNQIIESYVTGTPVIALDLGETREIYGELDNVHIVDYPLGGFPLTRKDDALRPEVYDDLVAETARLIVKISKEGDPVPPTVDYDKHGWPRRIDRELAIYDALVRGDAPE